MRTGTHVALTLVVRSKWFDPARGAPGKKGGRAAWREHQGEHTVIAAGGATTSADSGPGTDAPPQRAVDTRIVPTFDGDMTKWSDYEKKVRLYEFVDAGPAWRRAPTLYMMLTGKAWEVVSESLEPNAIATENGVSTVLKFLNDSAISRCCIWQRSWTGSSSAPGVA